MININHKYIFLKIIISETYLFNHNTVHLYSRRGLTPPHRVKSISMATFNTEEIDFIKSRGNEVYILIYSIFISYF